MLSLKLQCSYSLEPFSCLPLPLPLYLVFVQLPKISPLISSHSETLHCLPSQRVLFSPLIHALSFPPSLCRDQVYGMLPSLRPSALGACLSAALTHFCSKGFPALCSTLWCLKAAPHPVSQCPGLSSSNVMHFPPCVLFLLHTSLFLFPLSLCFVNRGRMK